MFIKPRIIKENWKRNLIFITIISIAILLFQSYVADLSIKQSTIDIIFRLAMSGIITYVAEQFYMKYYNKKVFTIWWLKLYSIMSLGVIVFYYL